MRYYLSPSLQDVTAHLTGTTPPQLDAADVGQRTRSFLKLAGDLDEFSVLIGALQASQEPLPGFAEPQDAHRSDDMDTE